VRPTRATILTPAGWVRAMYRDTIYCTAPADAVRRFPQVKRFVQRAISFLTMRRAQCHSSFHASPLTGGPIGRFVHTAGGQLVRLRTVCKHSPDLARLGTRGFKDQMAAVGRPTGAFIAALIAGQLKNLLRSGVHDVKVIVVVGAAPTEGQQLAVG